jgi:hypothetical protein
LHPLYKGKITLISLLPAYVVIRVCKIKELIDSYKTSIWGVYIDLSLAGEEERRGAMMYEITRPSQ